MRQRASDHDRPRPAQRHLAGASVTGSGKSSNATAGQALGRIGLGVAHRQATRSQRRNRSDDCRRESSEQPPR